MTPEEKARKIIDGKLEQSGWVIQDLAMVNPMASLGVAVREYPTNTGPVDYALFVEGKSVGVVEAKKDDAGENITVVEGQSGRYANSKFKYVNVDYHIRFAYEVSNYPVTVVLEESIAKSISGTNSGYIYTCNTRDELEELIVSVLTSKRIIKVMQELIRVNQAKKLSEEKEEADVDAEGE